MNEAGDYLKMMNEATAMRGSELKSQFKTMLFSYRNALGMLSGLKNELDELVSHIDNLDIETISNFYKPVLEKANDLVNKIELLDYEMKNQSDMKAYLSSIKTQLKSHNIDIWVRKFDDIITTIVKRYYENGQLQIIIPYVNGKINGIQKLYQDNGELLTETLYVNGKLEWEKDYMFSDDHKSYTMTPYVNGERHGTAKSYYGDGTLRGEHFYNNGVSYGTEKGYHKNGQLEEITPYVNGERHGIRKNYADDGSVLRETMYEKGKIYKVKENGYWDRGLVLELTVDNVKKSAIQEIYDSNGRVKSEFFYEPSNSKVIRKDYSSGNVTAIKNHKSFVIYELVLGGQWRRK